MTRFYLIRHGETEWNRDHNRFCGKTDIALSEEGAEQARRTAQFMRGTRIDAVYASTLRRAKETAAPIADSCGLTVQTDARIEEIDFAKWEGMWGRDIREQYAESWQRWYERPESNPAGVTGENASEVFARMDAFFRDTAAAYPDGHIAVVSHSTSIRIYLAGMLAMPFRSYRQLIQSNTGISVLETSTEGMRLLQFNCRFDSFTGGLV